MNGINLNFFPINLTDIQGPLSQIQSDENLVGTISPRDVTIFVVSLIIAYVVGIALAHHMKKRLSHTMKRDQLEVLIKSVRIGLVILALVISMPGFFDMSLAVVALILIGAGAVMALSSQKVISNFISGLALHYERPIGAGDYVTIGGVSGTVKAVRVFSTIIKTTSGIFVRIPNEQVYSTTVTNYFANVARRYEYEIGIRYHDDSEKAIRIIGDILERYTFVLKRPAPEVFVNNFDANSIRIKMRVWFPSAWANMQDDISLQTKILPQVKGALESEGIEFPYPQQVVWFANELVERERKD
jgi:small-conductance mechanosensitive channel